MLSVKPTLRRAAFYGASIMPNKPQKRFVLFYQGGTGSSLLIDLLNSHPKISADSEKISMKATSYPLRWPYSYVEGASKYSSSSIYDYKVKMYRIEQHRVNPEKYLKKHAPEG